MKTSLLPLLLIYFAHNVAAQTIIGRQLADQYPITSGGSKTYGLIWLPADYSLTTTNYPLIIFLHAGGEVGDGIQGLNNLINVGLPKKIAGGWDPQAVNPADGKTYKFIVVSPQAPTNSGWSYSYTHVKYILPNIISRYRIDTKRIYIIGISAGGAGTWSCVTNDSSFTKQFAAILPVSAAGVNNPGVESPNIKYISGKYGVKVWTVCGTQDGLYSTATSYVNTINTATPPPVVPAKLTGIAGLGHVPELWDMVFDASWRNNALNLNFYEWMLQYQREGASPPTNQSPVANAGTDKTITLPNNTVTVTGSGSDPDGTIASYLWTKISGPANFAINSPGAAQTVIKSLVAGVFQFELRVTDNRGTSRADTMTVTVLPAFNQPPVANAGNDQTITLPLSSITLSGSATDTDGTIASYLWSKISGPSQFTIASPGQQQTVVNNMVQGIYQFELKATDNGGAIAKDTLTVTVLPAPNQPPVADAGNDQSITLPTNSVTLSGSGADADGTIASYLWSKTSGPSQFAIGTPAQPQTVINNLVQGTYKFELKATDNGGAIAKDTLTVTVLPAPNQPPVADAGNDQSITLPTNSVTLSGSSADLDGTIESYQWTKIDGPKQFSIASVDQPQTEVNDLIAGMYQFEFKVTDNAGVSKADTVMIYVIAPPPNKLPVAYAGNDKVIYFPADSVLLTGMGSDTDGIISSYQWIKIDGPEQFLITSANETQTMITGLVVGIYQFELIVTDNDGAIGKDTVVITVKPANQPPVANAGDDQIIILPTNNITLSGSAADADGTITSYLWNKVGGPSPFTITSPGQPQTEVINLIQGIYQFELKVTDNNGDSKTDTVAITVLPPPNQPPIVNAGNDQVIILPTDLAELAGIANDPDGAIASYQWTKINGPEQFTIASPHQLQTEVNDLVTGTYQFEFKATDNEGASNADTVIVSIIAPPPNKLPVANAGSNPLIYLPANSILLTGMGSDTGGTISSYQWIKIDGPDQFLITSPNEAQTMITELVLGVYQFELTVTDNDGATGKDTVVITVKPANQPPVANAGNDQTITLPANSVSLSGSATDVDGTITSYLWNKVSGTSQFTIASPGQPQTQIYNLAQGIYQFEFKVTDDAGAATMDTVTVTVLPAPNQPPVANAGNDQTITLPANSVSLSGSATDADGTITSYLWNKISGPSQFTIASPAQPQTQIYNLVQGIYQFELKATDNADAVSMDTVAVTVLPAPNLPPVANAGNDQTITLPANSVSLSGSATDADGTIAAYLWNKISGPSQFTIASPGQPQTQINNLAQGTYKFELKATDNTGAVSMDTVAVTVLPAPNLPPVANAGNDQTIILPANSVSLSGSATDADGTISSYSWAKISGPAQFTISNSGIINPVLSNLTAGTYIFRFTATDNNGASATDDVTIIANPMLAGYKAIPGKIEAENYNAMSGINTENTSDAGGGRDVGWIDNGDWMDFNVYVDSSGTYTVNFRIATANTGAKFQLRKSDGTVLATLNIPNTGSYQGWITQGAVISLSAGYQTLRVISTNTLVWNFNWMEFARGISPGKPIPAKIEAEAYDAMLGIQMELTGDTGGGLDVGWLDNGDWLDYKVIASSAGTYTVNFRVATPNTGAKLQIRKSDGSVLATVNVPRTGGYQTWATVSTTISIAAGQQTLRIISTAPAIWNFNWLEFARAAGLIAQNTENISRSQVVRSSSSGPPSFEIIPNPVKDNFVLQVNSPVTGVVNVQIVDRQGVAKKEFRLSKNLNKAQPLSLSSYGLAPGVYTIRMQIGKWKDSKIMLKL